jgi:hypothetical protein
MLASQHHRGSPVLTVGTFLVILAALIPLTRLSAVGESLMLHDVSVVDVEHAAVRAHQDVTITDRIIAEVLSTASAAPATATIVDGSGTYVIPGLWDMHVHLSAAGADSLPLFVANGVLGVRDMGTDLAVVRRWRQDGHGRVAPRIMGAGALLDSQRFLTHVERVDRMVADRGVQPLAFDPPVQRVSLSAAAEVPSAVDRVVALEGVFVKVRTYESPDVFFAIAREAKRRGLRFAGHSPPENVSWSEAALAGMTSIEHMGGSYAAQLGQLSPAERRAVYGGLIRAGAFVDPNVVCEIIRAMPDTQARVLVNAGAAGPMTYNPWSTPQLKDLFRRELAIRILEKQVAPAPDWGATSRQEFTLLKELSSSGVPVLAGTDLGSLLIYPGFSLHDELQGLVDQVGLTPAEALRAATINPARFFEAASWGRVAGGQRADVVLLDGNPLENIRMTRRIRGVVLDGKYYNRSTLDTLLSFGGTR